MNIRFIGRCILWFIIVLVFEFLTSWATRGQGLDLYLVEPFAIIIKYGLLSFFVVRKFPQQSLPYLVGFHLFHLGFLGYLLYDSFLAGSFSFFLHLPILDLLGFWAGYLLGRSTRRSIQISAVVVSLFAIFLTIYFRHHLRQFVNLNTFQYAIHEPINSGDFSLEDEFGNIQTFHPDTLYILDVWYSGCAVCFKEFPNFNKKMLENKNPKIRYISVNKPIEEDEERTAFTLLKKYNYAFPVWKGNPEINETFGVSLYPTIIAVLNDTMLFRGHLALLDNFLEDFERGK